MKKKTQLKNMDNDMSLDSKAKILVELDSIDYDYNPFTSSESRINRKLRVIANALKYLIQTTK